MNAPNFPESKVTMKSTCFNGPCRTLILALLSGTALFGFSPGARAELSFIFTNSTPPAMPRRSSIILIVADGLGYGDLSCYGQTKFQTPNLDRLAAGGIRFTSYYAGDAASSPSRASLMLGKDSGRLKQRADVDVPLAADDITVAQVLKQSGYHTGFIGEWDLGGDGTSGAPWNKGFDEFAGYYDTADVGNYYADYVWRHDLKAHLDGKASIYANANGKNGQYMPDLFTTMAMNFAKNNQPDRLNHYRPFFLLLNYKNSGRRQRTRANGCALFRGVVAAAGKKQSRHDYAARWLHRATAGTIAKARHDKQRGDFFHERHRAANERWRGPEIFPERRAVSRRSRRPGRGRPAGANDCALAG